MNLCVPMIQVLLHSIIDDMRSNDKKARKMGKITEGIWWKKASLWITLARVGLPVTYVLVASAIVTPGIMNVLKEASNDHFKT